MLSEVLLYRILQIWKQQNLLTINGSFLKRKCSLYVGTFQDIAQTNMPWEGNNSIAYMIPDVKILHSGDIAEIGMHVIKARMQMKMKTVC